MYDIFSFICNLNSIFQRDNITSKYVNIYKKKREEFIVQKQIYI
jgi:hypothetical protein